MFKYSAVTNANAVKTYEYRGKKHFSASNYFFSSLSYRLVIKYEPGIANTGHFFFLTYKIPMLCLEDCSYIFYSTWPLKPINWKMLKKQGSMENIPASWWPNFCMQVKWMDHGEHVSEAVLSHNCSKKRHHRTLFRDTGILHSCHNLFSAPVP